MIRFDWYQSSVRVSEPYDSGLVGVLLSAYDLSDFQLCQNRNGYTYGGAIVRGDRKLCTLHWGGNPWVNVTATSEDAPALAQALREAFPGEHGPTRIDSCVDWVEKGLFDAVSEKLIGYAQDKGLSINQQGDWVRGVARTLYLGSKSSPVQLVLYEKGYEQGGDAPLDWVRLEVRIRPKKQHRLAVAAWEPHHIFGVSWVHGAVEVLGWNDLTKRSVGTVWRQSDDERAFAHLCKQYGPLFERLKAAHGSYEAVGSLIGEGVLNARSPVASRRVICEHVNEDGLLAH